MRFETKQCFMCNKCISVGCGVLWILTLQL